MAARDPGGEKHYLLCVPCRLGGFTFCLFASPIERQKGSKPSECKTRLNGSKPLPGTQRQPNNKRQTEGKPLVFIYFFLQAVVKVKYKKIQPCTDLRRCRCCALRMTTPYMTSVFIKDRNLLSIMKCLALQNTKLIIHSISYYQQIRLLQKGNLTTISVQNNSIICCY